MDSKLNVISLNVRGLSNRNKRKKLYEWVYDKKIDIACLQETFCTENKIQEFNNDFDGTIIHSISDSPHSRGVCMLISKKCKIDIVNTRKTNDGRLLLVNMLYNDNSVTIVCGYAPNEAQSKIKFLKKMNVWISQNCKERENLIICCDANTTMVNTDRVSKAYDKGSLHLNNLVNNLDLRDTWRYIHPDTIGHTWIDPSNNNNKSRIDFIFITENLLSCIKECSLLIPPVPDHKAVLVKINPKSTRGPGYWKLNVSLLDEDNFVKNIKTIFTSTVNEYSAILPKRTLWDLCKVKFKEFSIQYSIRKKVIRSNIINCIENVIADLDEQVTAVNTDKISQQRERDYYKEKLEHYYEEKYKGSQIRARAKWVEDGEKSTSFFLNLEKQRQCNNNIKRLLCKDGEVAETDSEILIESVKFYKDLYATNTPSLEDINKYLTNIKLKGKLTPIEQNACDGKVNEEECCKALSRMKANKAPGSDGLPAEFYKKCWNFISTFLIECYNEAYTHEELSSSQKLSILSLIFKKHDRELLKNYRPISLTNTDYKILAFTLANRMHKVISNIISEEQSAYIKDRFIGHNIRFVEDIIEYCYSEKVEGFLLFLDFEKAFDSIEWEFMYAVMKKMNFGEGYIRWIKTLYKNPEYSIKNNGWLSETFNSSRGIRQGCPISALLFILCTEVLARAVKCNSNISSIQIKCATHAENTTKIMQYADDSILFISDESGVKESLNTINAYSSVAGVKLNINKTEAIELGKHGLKEIHGIECKNMVRCLGIFVGKNKQECVKLNWHDKIEKMANLLKSWKRRQLSLFGKITVIKTLAIPKLVFSATNTYTPDNIIKIINKHLYGFIWNKRDRIKRNTLIGKIEDGGLNMVDIQSHFEALKAAWKDRIISQPKSEWNRIAYKYINQFGKNGVIFETDITEIKDLERINNIPIFYKQVICSYNKAKIRESPKCYESLQNELLWGNKFLVNGDNQIIYFKSWIESNILRVKDLILENGKLNTVAMFNKISNKRNYIAEAWQVGNAIKRFSYMLQTKNVTMQTNSDFNLNVSHDKVIYRAKYYYNNLIKLKFEKLSLKNWMNIIQRFDGIVIDEFDVCKGFIQKVKYIQDRRIAAFNYKVLSRSLICGYILSKWNDDVSSLCSVCKEEDNIEHMIYYCKNAQYLWKKIENVIGKKITLTDIVFGINDKHHTHNHINFVLSIYCYLLYKFWILSANNKCSRNTNQFILFIKKEIRTKMEIYKITKYSYISHLIARILDIL
jgi:exonuclease III